MIKAGIVVLALLAAGTLFWVSRQSFGLRVVEPKQIEIAVTLAPEQVKEARSGDGKMRLVGSLVKGVDETTSYTFKVVSGTDSSQLLLFSKTVDSGTTMEIPLNSWAPNNKQLFVVEKNGREANFFVYKADGGKYIDGADYLDVGEYWVKSKNKYEIRTITGWAGDDLLVVKTLKEDGSDGPSFWFVTSSRKFMRLRG